MKRLNVYDDVTKDYKLVRTCTS